MKFFEDVYFKVYYSEKILRKKYKKKNQLKGTGPVIIC